MKTLRSQIRVSVLAVAASLALGDAANAHHSFATHYDASKSTQISGVVTRWDFRSRAPS